MTNDDLRENIHSVRCTLQEGVQLVAVSKFHPASCVQAVYEAGQRVFGESREQELSVKFSELPKDIKWHFIGHLQTNKVKYIAPYVSMIEAVDSLKLLREIERQASRACRIIDVLLELHIAEEATKFGLTPDACRELLADGEWREMSHVRICGLMMMASNTDDEERIKSEFNTALSLYNEFKRDYFADRPYFNVRSWGMSHDYVLAMQCGSNMVRVGTAIFGERAY